jgi:hypothetical protein
MSSCRYSIHIRWRMVCIDGDGCLHDAGFVLSSCREEKKSTEKSREEHREEQRRAEKSRRVQRRAEKSAMRDGTATEQSLDIQRPRFLRHCTSILFKMKSMKTIISLL